jgi:GTP-dependent dephospho-CoA kinase
MVVYDAMTRRKPVGVSQHISSFDAEEFRVKNPAGHLEKEVFDLFRKLLKRGKPSKVFVEGEEDLTTLAAIKEAPAGYVVVYGQPGEGLVIVEVNGDAKGRVDAILEEMQR